MSTASMSTTLPAAKASRVLGGSSGSRSTRARPLAVPSGTMPIRNGLLERMTPWPTAVTVPSPPPARTTSKPSSPAPAAQSNASSGPWVTRTSTLPAPRRSRLLGSSSANAEPSPPPLDGLRMASTRRSVNMLHSRRNARRRCRSARPFSSLRAFTVHHHVEWHVDLRAAAVDPLDLEASHQSDGALYAVGPRVGSRGASEAAAKSEAPAVLPRGLVDDDGQVTVLAARLEVVDPGLPGWPEGDARAF